MKILMPIIMLSLVLISCRKESESLITSVDLAESINDLSSSSLSGCFIIEQYGQFSTNWDIHKFMGTVLDGNFASVDVGDVWIISGNDSILLTYNGSWSPSYGVDTTASSFFNSPTTLQILGGSSFPATTMTLTTSKEIEMGEPSMMDSIKSTDDIIIKWSPTEPTDLVMIYCEMESTSGFESFKTTTTDDGYFVISPNDMSSFPNEGRLKVAVMRGNIETTVVNASSGTYELGFANYCIDHTFIERY